MTYDKDKKGHDKSGSDNSKDRIEKADHSSEDLYDRGHREGFNKSEGWVTRPTTSETPTQPPTTQEGGKEE